MDAKVSELLHRWSEQEEWRVVDFHPEYSVSSHGKVRRTATGRILRPSYLHGYEIVTLSSGGRAVTKRVHRLVAFAFLGQPSFDGAMVAHNDGDQTNNVVSNLRWASAIENQADRARHNSRVTGSRVHGAKLTESQIPIVRQRAMAGERYSDIAADYGVSISTISLIKLGRIWRDTILGASQ